MDKSGWSYLVVEGNIGAGKTTLAKMIAERSSARLMLEQFSDNPFLPGFYKDPAKYAFPLELSFLAERYQQMKDELQPDLFQPLMVADYFVMKSVIFARINLPEPEFLLFERLFSIIRDHIRLPDRILYLHSEKDRLRKNIVSRGRSYEQEIPDDYLASIQSGYFELLKQLPGVPVVVVDVTEYDFVQQPIILEQLISFTQIPLSPGIHFKELMPPGHMHK